MHRIIYSGVHRHTKSSIEYIGDFHIFINTFKREPLQTQGILLKMTLTFLWWSKVSVTFFVSYI